MAATDWSSTSWPTSTRSSTSDPTARLAGLLRLVHPFPILVDAGATTAIALVAGAAAPRALLLGAGMLLLQASIGALNDLVDAPRDAGHKPGKPIPAGLVSPRVAALVAAAGAAGGLAVSAAASAAVLGTALLVLVIGFSYDLKLKGTAWSWLPFAVGIPLLPVYAWLGATGTLSDRFAVLVPTAVLAGAALSIGNALVDVERDRGAGVTSIAAALGARRAWLALAVLVAAVVGLAGASLLAWGRPALLVAGAVGIPALALVLALGLSRSREVGRRERGWQGLAVGIAVLASTWLTLALPR